MKRSSALLAGTLLSFVIAGCDSGGLKEGAPTGPVTPESAQPNSFKEEMKRNAERMKTGKKPAKQPEAPAAKS